MKTLSISILVALILIGGAYALTKKSPTSDQTPIVNNVSIIDGKQVIEITARGGYQPRKSLAKSGIPTVIRFKTNGTFDCSSSVRIPSLQISQFLPQTASTDIAIGTPKIGTLAGSCGMGMYPFEIEFQS